MLQLKAVCGQVYGVTCMLCVTSMCVCACRHAANGKERALKSSVTLECSTASGELRLNAVLVRQAAVPNEGSSECPLHMFDSTG